MFAVLQTVSSPSDSILDPLRQLFSQLPFEFELNDWPTQTTPFLVRNDDSCDIHLSKIIETKTTSRLILPASEKESDRLFIPLVQTRDVF